MNFTRYPSGSIYDGFERHIPDIIVTSGDNELQQVGQIIFDFFGDNALFNFSGKIKCQPHPIDADHWLRNSTMRSVPDTARLWIPSALRGGMNPGENERSVRRWAANNDSQLFEILNEGKEAFLSWLRGQGDNRASMDLRSDEKIINVILGEGIFEAIYNHHIDLAGRLLFQMLAWEPTVFISLSETYLTPREPGSRNVGPPYYWHPHDLLAKLVRIAPSRIIQIMIENGHKITEPALRFLFDISGRIDPTDPNFELSALSLFSNPLRGESLDILRLFVQHPEFDELLASMETSLKILVKLEGRAYICHMKDYISIVKDNPTLIEPLLSFIIAIRNGLDMHFGGDEDLLMLFMQFFFDTL